MSKFKFMIEIVTDIEELDIDYKVVQKHIKGDVEEAMRDYGLNVLDVECIFNQYTLKDFVKCLNQSEWICDNCMKCGDKNCCSGNHKMFRVPNTDDCLCSICL